MDRGVLAQIHLLCCTAYQDSIGFTALAVVQLNPFTVHPEEDIPEATAFILPLLQVTNTTGFFVKSPGLNVTVASSDPPEAVTVPRVTDPCCDA